MMFIYLLQRYATTLLEQGVEAVDEAKLTAALDYANAFQYGDPGKAGESLVRDATILRDKAREYTARAVTILNVMEKPDMEEIMVR